MNGHPDELLAEYVDGGLGPLQRAEVDAHLATCGRCRHELELARRARVALDTLPDEPAPPGIALEGRRRARASRGVGWRAAGIAAAAALVIAGAVVVARGGPGLDREGDAAAPAPAERDEQADQEAASELGPLAAEEGAARLAEVPSYRESDVDYDPRRIHRLGRDLRGEARAALEAGLPPTAESFLARFDPGAFTPEVRRALECVAAEVPPDEPVVPFTIEAARFRGQPAYVASFLQGPAPDARYHAVLLWVVDRDGCSLRHFARQRL